MKAPRRRENKQSRVRRFQQELDEMRALLLDLKAGAKPGVIHIGFLSSKKIFSPDRKVHASTRAVAFRFPSAVCGFAA